MRKNIDNDNKELTVSIIIATKCDASRENLLNRALKSIVNQENVKIEIIIVINGDEYDRRLAKLLKEDGRFIILHQAKANVSEARCAGVSIAQGDYFGFLDDDDEFLSHAFQERLSLAKLHHEADIIVTNGYFHGSGKDSPVMESGAALAILNRPVDVFFQNNWFASSASFFNAKTISAEFFNVSLEYFEWTYLFFLLISKGKRFCYGEALTYRVHKDTPFSLSKTIKYALAYPGVLFQIRQLPLPAELKFILARKYVSALNMNSNIERRQGQLNRAWHWHLKCLFLGGWRYVPYTRHLIKATIRNLI